MAVLAVHLQASAERIPTNLERAYLSPDIFHIDSAGICVNFLWMKSPLTQTLFLALTLTRVATSKCDRATEERGAGTADPSAKVNPVGAGSIAGHAGLQKFHASSSLEVGEESLR